MKPSLEKYLANHACGEFRHLKNAHHLSLLNIQKALIKAETADDFIALKTLINRNFKCKESSELIEKICMKSANISFENKNVSQNKDLNTISFMTNFPVDQHLNMLCSYLLSLMSINKQFKINILITCESDWYLWRGTRKQEWEDNILKSIISFLNYREYNVKDIKRIMSNISIIISPTEKYIAEVIGDLCIRFVGIANRTSTFIYAKHIMKIIPSISITFTSLAQDYNLSNVLFTRYATAEMREMHYITPVVSPTIQLNQHHKSEAKNIITIMSQDRIYQAFNHMTEKDWLCIKNFFDNNTSLNWLLIGSNNVKKVYELLNNKLTFKYINRFQIVGFVDDLDDKFIETFAYLCPKKPYGGGGAANYAFSKGIPVIVSDDWKSDVSNNTEHSTRSSNFEDSLKLIEYLYSDNKARNEFIKKQTEFYKLRCNLILKGEEFYKKLKYVFNNFSHIDY